VRIAFILKVLWHGICNMIVVMNKKIVSKSKKEIT
tara:strand:+ start:83 stop:187 length:105 start_codon:yes stop_codon:yes gene_type:complete